MTDTPCPLCNDKGYTSKTSLQDTVSYNSCTCLIGLQFAKQFCAPERTPSNDKS